MQALQLIIFAGLAAIVLYQLYAVLGRRVGRQPGDQPAVGQVASAKSLDAADPSMEEVTLTGLAAVRARDPSFDVGRFLTGARQAYQIVVEAFAKGDREALKTLLSPSVLESFEKAIAQRDAEGRSELVEFPHPPRADLEKADVVGDLARVTVRFLAEFRARGKGPEGESVEDRRTAELWTFERSLKSRDPNWTLIHVDAAEA